MLHKMRLAIQLLIRPLHNSLGEVLAFRIIIGVDTLNAHRVGLGSSQRPATLWPRKIFSPRVSRPYTRPI